VSDLEKRFDTEQDAAYAVLTDVAARLAADGVNAVMVGGWVPWLFHQGRYRHPGTFDVDVLLHGSAVQGDGFSRLTEAMLSDGYLRAAKNNFQIHRVLTVDEERVIFHVDFLNESAPIDDFELSDLVVGQGRIRSIHTPAMKLVFKYGGYRFADLDRHPGLRGAQFPSADTFIASKAAAVNSPKRQRDAFDIFVTLLDEGPENVSVRWRELRERDSAFAQAGDAIAEAFRRGIVVEKALRFLPNGEDSPDPASDASPRRREVEEVFQRFLSHLR
jgi:hypothetical protein